MVRNESRASYYSISAERSPPLPFCRLAAVRNGLSIPTLIKQTCPVKPTHTVLSEAFPAPWDTHQLYTGRLNLLKHTAVRIPPLSICCQQTKLRRNASLFHQHFQTIPKIILPVLPSLPLPTEQITPAVLSLREQHHVSH